jgi:hypothetical protein
LQGFAEANTVVIFESTRKPLGNLFDLQELGAQDRPVRAWIALRSASIESRFEALHASGLTELVGRECVRELAAQFLALAERQGATVPLMIGHRLTGNSLMSTGDIAQGRMHQDRAISLYDPVAGRSGMADDIKSYNDRGLKV